MPSLLACDLGAESGRVIAARIQDGRISFEEIHRFPTGGTRIGDSFRWNIIGIFEHIRTGLSKAAKAGYSDAVGVSVDSWGVDYVWFREGQPLLSLPYHYRDSRTDPTFKEVRSRLGDARIYNATGNQFMPLNSLYQFADDAVRLPEILSHPGSRWLNIADYLNYLLSGVARAEESLASTTQIFDPNARFWSLDLTDAIRLPRNTLPSVVASGSRLGPLTDENRNLTGLRSAEVIASCSHDTAAAVAAVPTEGGEDWAYLSSGTWSLLGLELPKPLISEEVLQANFTNEIGFGGSIRFLKVIAGLWILQETRRDLDSKGSTLDYHALNEAAAVAPSLRSLINPNDPRFLKPGDMISKICAYCSETGQPLPETPGQLTRCILESLALFYDTVVNDLERLTSRTIRRIHIVGGGSRSDLLNQFTACATGRRVTAGPGEATALGNIAVQAIALGILPDLPAARAMIRGSSELVEYSPRETDSWSAARELFQKLTAAGA